MMITDNARILDNHPLAPDIWRLTLETDIAGQVQCGQFVQVQVPGYFLRRPISVCQVLDNHTLVLVYKTVGDGTRAMTGLSGTVNLFGPLGNGFPIEDRDVTLIGGGVGVPPLVETAHQYHLRGHQVTAVLGFSDVTGIMLVKELEEQGCTVYLATMDGSAGTKGTVLDAVREHHLPVPFVLACGPMGMLKAVSEMGSDGYVSLEARMACGIGACMGCVVHDVSGGSLRVCKDGPVFPIGKVVL